jgi:alkylation response protein AidB-like acyl-CoA dehydrogenase
MAERGGPHAQDLKTTLIRAGTGRRLSGRKYYCTGALTARWIGVSALDDADRLVLAFVERDAPGVRLDQDWNVMGQRATVSGGAAFDDVAVDPDLVLPYQQAFERPQQLGARTQLVHAAIETGIAGGALRDAGDYLRTRARPFFEAARAGWAQAAAADPHTIHRYGQLAAKVAAVASDLFALSGASAADERHDLSRHWRNARTHGSHDPVAWKYHHIGNYLLNGALPPNHGQI